MTANSPPSDETLWPRSAQVAAALLVLTSLGLLAWHGHLGSRSSTRPSEIQRAGAGDSSDQDEESEDNSSNPGPKSAPKPGSETRKPMPAVGIKKMVAGAGKIDVNRATLVELQKLPHVGPTLAARIIERRNAKPFETVEDLRKVKGIGAKTLEEMRPVVTVGSP
jgi:competence ComEA-like helix-hairpin-helix protein